MEHLIAKEPTIDSREVAEMVGKQHAHLCRDIAHYIDVISTNPKLDSLDSFKEEAYMDKKGGRQRQNFEWYEDFLLPIVVENFGKKV